MTSANKSAAQLSAREAVRAAVAALPDLLGGRSPKGVRVEEVRPPRQDDLWRVTLSYLEPADERPEHPLLANPLRMPAPDERVLRVVEVEAASGAVVGMVLRENSD